MKLLLIADGRSPITRRWISMLQPLGFEIVLLSSYPCEPPDGIKRFHILPLAFAAQGGAQAGSGMSSLKKMLINKLRPLALSLRHQFGPRTVSKRSKKYLEILQFENPDLVHALRIPFEGMLAGFTPVEIPLILSTWGNDFTLHAPSTPEMTMLTQNALQRANALISDTRRDVALACEWGFDRTKPSLVVPGNGGLNLQELEYITRGIQKAEPPQLINPRGLRSYVRTDTFFKAIPLILAKRPDVKFACASMAGQTEALEWVQRLGIEKNVRLLPYLSQPELWKEYARSQVTLSISTHDGTPNTLLEAMALGCLPICGDLDSIREWIVPGKNGVLINPTDPKALAEAVLESLGNQEFQESAARWNVELIRLQANLEFTREKVKQFYARFA